MKTPAYLAFLVAVPIAAGASEFDGSKELICATVEAIDCAAGDPCVKGRPAEIGAPPFMRIDFAKNAITGPQRTTPILSIEKSEAGQLLLQGNELGYGWTLALNTTDGSMGATLVNRDGVFVLFGSCMPL
jgi:hypothetical protein